MSNLPDSPFWDIAKPAPHHNGPRCPGCKIDGLGSPIFACPRWAEFTDAGPNSLWCPACGHRWTSDDPWEVAQAWHAFGAWEGVQHCAGGGTKRQRVVVRYRARPEPHAAGQMRLGLPIEEGGSDG